MAEFVARCPNYQQVNAEHQKSSGLPQVMNVPTRKWEDINVDSVVGLPQIHRQNDSIWVIMDRLMKSSQFIPVKSTYLAEEYGKVIP